MARRGLRDHALAEELWRHEVRHAAVTIAETVPERAGAIRSRYDLTWTPDRRTADVVPLAPVPGGQPARASTSPANCRRPG